ncbi:MAG TPA: hypothetical protein VMM80_09260 [Bacteroidota bacterium]|nr:hypothetical protein [Bacteroidota bacterium]
MNIRTSAAGAIALALATVSAHTAFAQKKEYFDDIRRAVEKGWKDYPAVVSAWKKAAEPNVLWGYNPPAHPVYLAAALGFLYHETHDTAYASKAARLLLDYADLPSVMPASYARTRVEYADGIPPLTNFFFLPPFVRSWLWIRDYPSIDARERAKIESAITRSVDFVFTFPEWGSHNRAMLRAEALAYAVRAFPDHPHAAKWKQMSDVIASDSRGHWEIEDATNYNPVWLHALCSWAAVTGDSGAYTTAMMRYYDEYYTQLISPAGIVPDFGDATWNSPSGGLRFVAIFEKWAAVFRDPGAKWAAQSIYMKAKTRRPVLGIDEAYHLADAYAWCDESVPPRRPDNGSREVLDDIVGKKVVFRSGWDSTSTYLLLDYRDEGDGGWLSRDYLRRTITVEEEKMTHGHSDENSVPLMMDGGSVLLHDGGYRDSLPSGAYGAWRADYFHNRLIARAGKRDRRQSLLDFVHNTGAYRTVQTSKIDFMNLRSVDMSRTRLVDQDLGYQSDRVIAWVRDPGCFIVIDGIRVLRDGYYTFAALWHAQNVLARGRHYYDIATDSVPGYRFPRTKSLLVYFPETYAKADGVEPEWRHSQPEHVVYQAMSSQYKQGDCELFVSILVPHDRGVDPASIVKAYSLVPTSAPYRTVAVAIGEGPVKKYVYSKLDLEMDIARENIRPRYLWDLGKVSFGDFETDAGFFYAAAGPRTLEYSASTVLKVLYKGDTLMAALPNTHGLQPDGGSDTHVGYSKWRYWEDVVPLDRKKR